MIKIKNLLLGLLALSFAFTSCSKSNEDDNGSGNHLPSNYPTGYYRLTEGKTEAQLKTQLYNIIKGHKKSTYYQLWTDFRSTDARPDGTVWDIYDKSTRYQFGVDQDKGGGDANKYNREHSFPKSWFNTTGSAKQEEQKSIYTDLFHLYPCDTKANSVRSNNPYFLVSNQSWSNGYCKSGSTSGYPGKVFFEPADEIKGDLARTYFYIATRYENGENGDLSNWPGSGASSRIEILSKTSYPFYTEPMLSRLLEWHRQDPVSKKEVDRNEAIYGIQRNRNPYIDCPDMVEYIWGNKKGQPYHETK